MPGDGSAAGDLTAVCEGERVVGVLDHRVFGVRKPKG